MKKPITLALSLLTALAVAQPYNKTFDVNLNSDNLKPSFVITNSDVESITVSYASDGSTLPRNDYFVITKHDAGGNEMYNNIIRTSSYPKDGFTNVEALIQTDDKGVLIAGYYYENDKYVEEPFLMKVDKAGNHLWTRIYHGVNKRPILRADNNKISLCRVFDEDKETYFIVAASDWDKDPKSKNSVATNVIKVDENGTPLFIKKYYDANETFPTFRDYPGDIEFTKKDSRYMITGRRYEADDASKNQNMYFFRIDKDGNLGGTFLTLTMKSVPVDQDMVYDADNNVFGVTFTHAKNGYNSVNSVIGFLNIDYFYGISNTRYYWHDKGSDHNGRSISLAKGGYVIGSDVIDADNGLHNPAWLRIDNSANIVGGLLRYNVDDNVIFGHHALQLAGGSEEFILANEQRTDLRLIDTDNNGEVCGVEKFETYNKEWDPKKREYDYKNVDFDGFMDYTPKEKNFTIDGRDCKEPGNTYRLAGTTGISQLNADNITVLYPSVMSADNARLTVINSASESVKIEISNIAGQLIYADSKIATGTTEIQLNTNGKLSEGLYLAKIYNANGTTQITKLLITK